MAEFGEVSRTDGDGMEHIHAAEEFKISKNKVESKVKKTQQYGMRKQKMSCCLIELTPKSVDVTSHRSNSFSKGPKFVPYEPYPAAVKPMVPFGSNQEKFKKRRSKNNLDINVLISQMSQIDTKPSEFKKKVKTKSYSDTKSTEVNSEHEKLLNIIDDLKKENDNLKDQMKQQVQVNKELKTMLVASMGEDLEVQVQSLNDDKKHLANALFNSAQHLSTHQEQTEWLAGQCEVWRSKFLASSLMVEELAGWKRVLSTRTEELQQAIKQMLEERCRVRDILLYIYRNLYSLHEKWLAEVALNEVKTDGLKSYRPLGSINFSTSLPHTSNIIDLASVNLKLSDNLSSNHEKYDDTIKHLETFSKSTDAEIIAEKILASPLEIKRNSDMPLNALVNHAYAKSGEVPTIACCSHCNGQVQLL